MYSRCAVSTSVHVFIQSLQDIVTFFFFYPACITSCFTRNILSNCVLGFVYFPPYLLCCAHLSADFVKAFARPVDRPGGSAPAYVDWPVKKKKKNSNLSSTPPRTGLCWLTETLCCVLSPSISVFFLFGKSNRAVRFAV